MQKAVFSPYNPLTRKRGEPSFRVPINPESVSISSQNQYQLRKDGIAPQKSSMEFTFLSQLPSRLSMELVCDTYRLDCPERELPDVRNQYASLKQALAREKELHAPPVLLFSWGTLAFVGQLVSLQERFTLFSGEGVPVRARLQVEMQGCLLQDLPAPVQNSPDRTKLEAAVQGENLWAIAERVYASPALWRPIARENKLRNPRRLLQAQHLHIPVLSDKDNWPKPLG